MPAPAAAAAAVKPAKKSTEVEKPDAERKASDAEEAGKKDKKSRSTSRGFVDRLKGKKEEAEVMKEEKKEDKKEEEPKEESHATETATAGAVGAGVVGAGAAAAATEPSGKHLSNIASHSRIAANIKPQRRRRSTRSRSPRRRSRRSTSRPSEVASSDASVASAA